MPIILYNVPGRTGTNMLPETIAELAKDEFIVGVKEASGNMEQVEKIIELTRGKKPFTVLSGDDNLTLPIMAMGGKGVVSVLANIMPKEMCAMVKYYDEGNHNKAIDLYYKIAPIMKGMFIETNPIPVKAAANMIGVAAGTLRLPLTEMAPENQKKLKVMMDAYGVKPIRKTAMKVAPIKASVKKARK
jgi:4-hydroxy-tetrahydrodipicolinate synthase